MIIDYTRMTEIQHSSHFTVGSSFGTVAMFFHANFNPEFSLIKHLLWMFLKVFLAPVLFFVFLPIAYLLEGNVFSRVCLSVLHSLFSSNFGQTHTHTHRHTHTHTNLAVGFRLKSPLIGKSRCFYSLNTFPMCT